MGGNFRVKLDKAPTIRFRGFKFRGTMGGNMNLTFEHVCDCFGSGLCVREATTSMKIFGRLVNARLASVLIRLLWLLPSVVNERY